MGRCSGRLLEPPRTPHSDSSSASAVPPIFFYYCAVYAQQQQYPCMPACNAHACIYIHAEQRPAAPSGHAQPSGRICSRLINQSINQAINHSYKMQSFPVPSIAVVCERSIKRLVSPRLACCYVQRLHRCCQQITAAVVEWRPVQHLSHPLPPYKSDLSVFGPIMSSLPPSRHAASV